VEFHGSRGFAATWLVFLCAVAAAGAANAAQSGTAGAYPVRPVRVVVGYPSGSINDMLARFVGPKLTDHLGQQVVVDNRAGANGIIGAELVARAAADGYTLLFMSTSHTMNAALYKLPFDPVRSFTPLTTLGKGPLVLIANPALSATSVKGLIELARAQPNSITYAIAGTGSIGHFAGALFARSAGVQLVNVPYRGGAQALADLLAGQVQLMFSTAALARSQIKSGRVRALGVTTAQRSPLLPEVPTIAESGLPGYDVSIWWGALAPAGLPPAIASRLTDEIARILRDPESAKRLENETIVPLTISGPDFSRLMTVEVQKWQRTAREADIKAE
jgi:tripartite-type tricarboxylate transporter receptor subunit TctC